MTDAARIRPRRSMLYMPGSNVRALEKAKTLAADSLILDLEDAVAPGEKPDARAKVCAAVKGGGYGAREVIIRVNGQDTEWGTDDVRAAAEAAPDAVLLPKVNSVEQIHDLDARLRVAGAPDSVAIWAMMETSRGVLNAGAIAAAPRLQGFVMGTNDLLKEMRARYTPSREPLLMALGMCVLAARANNIAIVDGVYNSFHDELGLQVECEQSKEMGFDGKTLIHPKQLPMTNMVFGPSEDDLSEAEQYVEAYEAAVAEGKGVAVVDGKIVENLHVAEARRVLALAEAIAALEAESA